MEKRTFFTVLFNLKFENVFLALHLSNFVRAGPRQRAIYSCKKYKTYPLAIIHPLYGQTDGRAERRTHRAIGALGA